MVQMFSATNQPDGMMLKFCVMFTPLQIKLIDYFLSFIPWMSQKGF